MRPPGVTVIVLAWAALAAAALAAQGRSATARAVDRVVAVVGTKPILASQVEEQLVLAQSQGAKVPEDSAGRDAARRQILSQMVDEELLVQQAERDTTIKVTDQEVQDAVEQTVQNVRKQFTSITEFQAQLRAAGFWSEEEWRLARAGWGAGLVPSRLDGKAVRGRGVPPAPRDDLRRRADRVRLPHHPGRAGAARGDPGPPHPDPADDLGGPAGDRQAAGGFRA